MSVTTTVSFPITLLNTTGHQYYTVQYRVSGTSQWTDFNTSASTATVSGLQPNILYDFEVINVNGTTNPPSAIVQGANITDPNPTFSPVNNAIAFSWTNLSADITGYVTTIALQSAPTIILATHNPAVNPTVTDTFSGLSPLTLYAITITAAIGSIIKTFTYTQVTTAISTCPSPLNVTAQLV